MKRREFIGGLALAAGVSACGKQHVEADTGIDRSTETFKWNMVTSWPPGLPGLGVGAENLAKHVEKASNSRLKIKVYAGGELVPALRSPFRVGVNCDHASATKVVEFIRKARLSPEVQIPENDRECFEQIGLAGAVMTNQHRHLRIFIEVDPKVA